MTEKEYALIVAGGKGTRFGGPLPKQFLELNGKPVLLHTLEAFYDYSATISVVLVLPEEDHQTWGDIAKKYHFEKPVVIQTGGASRFQSVKKGLEKVGEGLVAIHDGVRPLISRRIIQDSFRLARIYQCAVAAVGLKESIRRINDLSDGDTSVIPDSTAVDRSRYRIIQTPQTFDAALIKKAYGIPEDITLTDDASVAEKSGRRVFLFDGSYENIKITCPEDLAIAEALLASRSGM